MFESADGTTDKKKLQKQKRKKQSKSGNDDILEYLEQIMNSPDEATYEKPPEQAESSKVAEDNFDFPEIEEPEPP